MILGRTQLHLEELVPTPLQYRELVRKITLLQEKYGPEKIEWGDPVDHLIRFRTLAKHCVNIVDIRANGDIIASPYLPLTVGNIRRHSIREYWDRGLVRIWELPKVRELAERICSVPDFGKKEKGVPSVWFDKNLVWNYSDFREIGKSGWKMPYKTEIYQNNEIISTTIIKAIEIDKVLPDEIFDIKKQKGPRISDILREMVK